MKVLVTGGAGFIGSHLVDRLVDGGHDVIVLDKFSGGNKLDPKTIEKIDLIEGDVRNEETVHQVTKGCDLVYHLAGYLGVDAETMETETLGIRNVGNACIAGGVERLIYISSSGVYGKAAIEQDVDEDFLAAPISSYAIAKRYNEIYLQALFQEKHLQSCSLRYFNVYGPRQDERMVIPRFFYQALKGEPLTVYGNGQQTRDFTYIDDVIEATVLLAERFQGCEIVNIAKGEDASIVEIANKIIALTESDSEVALINPPQGRYDFEVQRRCGNSDKLKRIAGFIPSLPLDEGLKKTFEFIKNSSPVAGQMERPSHMLESGHQR